MPHPKVVSRMSAEALCALFRIERRLPSALAEAISAPGADVVEPLRVHLLAAIRHDPAAERKRDGRRKGGVSKIRTGGDGPPSPTHANPPRSQRTKTGPLLAWIKR